MRCPSCDRDNRADRRFCAECGTPLVTLCAVCGEANGPGEKFCGGCGRALQGSGAPSRVYAPDTRQPQPDTQGERRHLTVLFSDLVGSTELSTQLDPEEWRDVVGQYHRTTADAVKRFGGHVVKYLGDGVLALFGYPHAHDDDAEQAVRAGLAIVGQMPGVGSRMSGPSTHPSTADTRRSVRVGIHTGLTVIAGAAGEADVFGETPNLAARVQGVAEPDTVVITAATQRLVAGLFVVEDRGAQRLKGVPQPVTLYRVVQPSGVRSRLDVSAGRHTPFVGRQTELGVLNDAWERVVDGLGQAVLVQGEAGIGKSRLCYELRQHLSGEPHTWLECRCSPYTAGTAFRPVTELVDQALGFQATDSPAEKLGKLAAGLARSGLSSEEALPLLAEWLELPEIAGYTALAMSPDLKRGKTLETLAAWNLKLGELQPMVVLVEDLHWCDPSSLELLGRLIAGSATARVLLVGTARPEFAVPWPARSNLQTLMLGRLTKRQTREVVRALCAGIEVQGPGADPTRASQPLTPEVLDALVARADGIPLFAEELTQAVLETGSDAAGTAIPVTLQDSLLARLDRLSSAKKVAQVASVLGRDFSYALLRALMKAPHAVPLPEAHLREDLTRLVEAELLFARGDLPEATYTFKHALVQEAAYQSLLKRTRQQLHGCVVDVLVAEFPDRVTAEPEVVARHAELAGRTDQAIAHYQRAGEQGQARSAHVEAIGQFQRAIAQLASRPESRDRDEREAALQLAVGASLVAARGFAHGETATAYERARGLAERGGDAAQIALTRIGLSVLYISRGEPERGRALAAEVLAQGEARSDAEEALIGHTQVAAAELYQGRFSSSFAHAERALTLYDPERHRGLVRVLGTDQSAAAFIYTASNLWALGWPSRALSRAEEAVAFARRLDHPFSLGFAIAFAAAVDWWRGDHLQQQARGAEVIALSEALSFPLWLGVGHALRGAARVAGGDAAGLAEVVEGLTLAGETGIQAAAPLLIGLLAEAQRAVGQFGDARATVASGLAVAGHTGQPFHDAELHRLDGELLLATGGAPAEAEARFHRALGIARRRSRSSCAPRPASRASGETRAGASRRASCLPRSTPGSPKVSRPPI